MIFNSLPSEISERVTTLFADSPPTIAILPLHSLDNQPQAICSNWLHEKEQEQLAKLTFKKRNREWLGGRMCAKESLRIFLLQQENVSLQLKHQQSRIGSEESGRPYFSPMADIDYSFPELSISHSNDFATAICCNTHCGIDIQYQTPNLLKVKECFASPAEEHLLHESFHGLTTVEQLSLLWAGKESLKKMLSPFGMPGFHELTLQTIRPNDKFHGVMYFSHPDTPKEIFPVVTSLLRSGYALALCCRTEQAFTPSQIRKNA